MNQAEISALANDIAKQTIALHWWFWLVLIALTAAGSYFAALVPGYAKRRGQNLATKADFQDLLVQTRRTTEEVEKIRSQVSLGEWTEKEYRSLRRVKLEELLIATMAAEEWLSREHVRLIFDSDRQEAAEQEQSPIIKVSAIGGLYFPELRREVLRYRAVHAGFEGWLRGGRLRIIQTHAQHPNDELAAGQARIRVITEYRDQLGPHWQAVVDACAAVVGAAEALMPAIVVPQGQRR